MPPRGYHIPGAPTFGRPKPGMRITSAKLGEISTNRGAIDPPRASQRPSPHSDAYTFIGNGTDSQVLYAGDRRFAQVTATLTNEGKQASVGTRTTFSALAGFPAMAEGAGQSDGGQAQPLLQNIPVTIVISNGSSLYVAADVGATISVVVEPMPWLEEFLALWTTVLEIVTRRLR